MKIQYDQHLGLSEFERAALKTRFVDLIRAGELRSMNCDEYYLEHDDKGYVLAPNLVFDEEEGETVTDGYILMRETEWNI